MGLVIGVDIGGTKVAAGVVSESGEVREQVRRNTPVDDPGEVIANTIDVIRELVKTHEVSAVGIGAAGWMNSERTTVLFAPNLPWRDEPLLERIEEAVDLPVVIENDGNVAAWGEFRFGAGRGADESMALFTVGTGIGGGLILGGEVHKGANGIAGELGHTRSVADGHQCRCGRFGCLEQYASGTALVRFARVAAESEPESAQILLELAGGSPEAVTGPIVTTAAQLGDPAARGAFERIGRWLGPAMADIVQVVDPQVVVIGGGVAEAGDLLFKPASVAYRTTLAQRGLLPVAPVRLAMMGNIAGLVGAADLARRRLGGA